MIIISPLNDNNKFITHTCWTPATPSYLH